MHSKLLQKVKAPGPDNNNEEQVNITTIGIYCLTTTKGPK